MDPGLAGRTSPEPRKTEPTEPVLTNLPGNEQEPEPDDDEDDSCTTSTTSDTSDGDDFFQIGPLGLEHPMSPNPIKPSERLPPLSPVLPTMVHTDVPDPNRIPSSIFTRTKSTSPMEWSVASNESLFSIHMGNSSFSRDPMFFMGRSGEMNSSTGMDSYPLPPISPISSLPPLFPPVSPLPPPIPPVPSSLPAGLDTRLVSEKAEARNATAKMDVLRTITEEQEYDPDKEKSGQDAVHFSKSISHQSEGSAASFQSFAFPILAGDGGESGSIKIGPEHQQMQQPQPQPQPVEQQTPKIAENQSPAPAPAPAPAPTPAPPPAEEKGWLSCFSCCPSCC